MYLTIPENQKEPLLINHTWTKVKINNVCNVLLLLHNRNIFLIKTFVLLWHILRALTHFLLHFVGGEMNKQMSILELLFLFSLQSPCSINNMFCGSAGLQWYYIYRVFFNVLLVLHNKNTKKSPLNRRPVTFLFFWWQICVKACFFVKWAVIVTILAAHATFYCFYSVFLGNGDKQNQQVFYLFFMEFTVRVKEHDDFIVGVVVDRYQLCVVFLLFIFFT